METGSAPAGNEPAVQTAELGTLNADADAHSVLGRRSEVWHGVSSSWSPGGTAKTDILSRPGGKGGLCSRTDPSELYADVGSRGVEPPEADVESPLRYGEL